MPHHSVPRADIDAFIEDVEQSNTEEVISVVSAGDGAFDVFTKPKRTRKAGERETR